METHFTFSGFSTFTKIVDLLIVFMMSMFVELLSHTRFVHKIDNNVVAGFIQTAMYGIRTAMALMVMLAVMSFDVAIFVAAVGGFSTGFFTFGSRLGYDMVEDSSFYGKPYDLPPSTC